MPVRISPVRSRVGQNGEFPLLDIPGTEKKSGNRKERKKQKRKQKKQAEIEAKHCETSNGFLKGGGHGEENGNGGHEKENGNTQASKRKCWEEPLDKSGLVVLDVGGERYRTSRDAFLKYPNSRLGKLLSSSNLDEILTLCEEYTPSNPPEFFFDKNPENFSVVMELYRSGKLHIPDGAQACAMVMRRDFDYWGIDELLLEPCCALKFYPKVELCNTQIEKDIQDKEKAEKDRLAEDFGDSKISELRSFLWAFLEKPWTSTGAQIYAWFSLFVILVSTVTFVMSTADELQVDQNGDADFPMVIFVIELLDLITVGIFTLEYSIRFICSPCKKQFFLQPMNLIDFATLFPFYMSLILQGLEDYEIIGKAGKIMRLAKVMRILRVYKLFRHFAGLHALIYTVQQAYKELGLLLHVICVSILVFASLVYVCESEVGEQVIALFFPNQTTEGKPANPWTFGECFWWAIMTVTTVGYDVNLDTFLGRVVGGMCAMVGVFAMTLPLPIVVNSFSNMYDNQMWRNEVGHKKRLRQKSVDLAEVNRKLIDATRKLQQPTVLDGDIHEMNRVRSTQEMTVRDIINLKM